ncbi:Uncharacterised protein [Segatella buccae]|jgi:hypothetical protein|nr:Uncharacterised protein [Segatella buccae]
MGAHKEKKGKKIMKKMILMAVALLSMTTATFAADENASAANAASAYNMNVNMSSLADALGLNIDQVEAVADIHKNFSADMLNAASASAEDRQQLVNKAIEKDLKYMHYILSNQQYRKYLLLLNTTINNRGLNK